MNAVFRSGTMNDATACGTICYEAFKAIAQQHNFPPTFPLQSSPLDCCHECCHGLTCTLWSRRWIIA